MPDRDNSKSPDQLESHLPDQPEEVFFEESELLGEGLPPDYRMRHEVHYVDEIVAAGRMPQLRLVPVSQIESTLPAGTENLEPLADSIQEFGVLQPLLVRRERGRYELLSGAKRLAAAVSVGLKEVPCLLIEADDLEARRLAEAASRSAGHKGLPLVAVHPWSGPAAALAEGSLHTILSTLGLLVKPESSLRDQVAVGLIRAEAVRASRLLYGVRLLTTDPPVVRRPLDLGALLEDVVGESEDERALLAIELESSKEEPCTIRADRQLLSMAIAGSLETVISLLRSSRGAKLHVRLSRNPITRGASIFIGEDAVRMPTSSWSRWFDPDWEKRPGGPAAGVALFAARRATELHGGRLELSPTESGGVRISLVLPEG